MTHRLTFHNYENVFTPSHPVTIFDFLVGREREVADLRRGLKRKGEIPVVVGNRGVGKTSLVSLGLKGHNHSVKQLNCYEGIAFNDLAKMLLKEADVNVRTIETNHEVRKKVDSSIKVCGLVGIGSEGEQKDSVKSEGLAKTVITPWDLFSELKSLNRSITFILDEYDRVDIDDQLFHSSVADLLKMCADHSDGHMVKFVIVGISDSTTALLGKHRSIERSAKEIYVRPLRDDDITTFLIEAEEKLQFSFQDNVKQQLVHFSMGYPYYVHLVGVSAIDAMVQRLGKKDVTKRANRVVTEEDYVGALKTAVRRAFQSNLSKYRKGMQRLDENEVEIVKALCMVDDRTSITRQQLRQRLAASHRITDAEFDNILLNLQQHRGIIHISRTADFVRFYDPLMASFLRAWYCHEKLIPYSAKENPNQVPWFEDDV